MWSEGLIQVPLKSGEKVNVRYWVKHFENPSEWGIDEGRISKLNLKIDGRDICNYDRGWDVRPETQEALAAFSILMGKYN